MVHEPRSAQDRQPIDRRSFMGTVALALTALVGLCGAAIAAVFTVAPALGGKSGGGDADVYSRLPGAAPDPAAGPRLDTVSVTTSAGWAVATESHAVYVDATADGTVRAFSARCPHEGCHVDWRENPGEYVCPCHDSRWTREGDRVGGPTKRGLDPLPVRKGEGGALEVAYKTFALDTPDRIQVG